VSRRSTGHLFNQTWAEKLYWRSPPTRYRSRWRRDPKPNSHSVFKQRVAHHREGRPHAAESLIIKNAVQVVFVSIAEIGTGPRPRTITPVCTLDPTRTCCLAALERELQSGPFCRIHRSTIVNVDRIRSLELMDDGEYAVVKKTRIRLRLSRGFRKSLRHRLGLRRAWQPVGLGIAVARAPLKQAGFGDRFARIAGILTNDT
jgi:hypothetical protein